MKKKIVSIMVFTLAAALAAFALVGCGGNNASSAATAAADFDGNFVVGFDQEYPPYGFVGEDGEFTGFDLELAQEVCARNGWTYSAVPINWDTKLEELNAGAFVCIWNGFTMEGREADYAFSQPYMDNGQVIMVKADSDIDALADLADKTVGTQVDSAAQEVLEGDQADLAATFAALETRADYNIAATELEAGALDALACDLSIAAYQMSQNPGAFKVLDEQLSAEHYAVGFKLGNDALADQVTTTLQEMAADGTVEALCNKYAEYGISFDNWVLK
ncbi:MAG: transporter substrate-binding domain-containing protein [Eggerthellaceae bacterium]|nr:transporter substrate-binding domain-containing protein [Eggerthellaceae bacterium]